MQPTTLIFGTTDAVISVACSPTPARHILMAASAAEEPQVHRRSSSSSGKKPPRRMNSLPSGSAFPPEEPAGKPPDSDLTASMLVGYRSIGLGLWGSVRETAGSNP